MRQTREHYNSAVYTRKKVLYDLLGTSFICINTKNNAYSDNLLLFTTNNLREIQLIGSNENQ